MLTTTVMGTGRQVLLAAAAVLLIGCSGASKTVTTVEKDLQYYIDHINEYEDFDEASYVDPPPVATTDIVHDVPQMLMSGMAVSNARLLETMQGFRIQIHSSLDKEGAVSAEERAKAWWGSVPEDIRPASMQEDELPVYLKYVQPYYRVRVGDFVTREEAEVALEMIAERFPRAFIAIDTVTVWR
jgi:hypothetical protein